ncbi:50S ribosomal protein L10 [Candidatus Bathyarchaeota archaeon]|nr:50S ribosomal protein L10 [Candidatus Bathyarchaeota archaeon]
MVSRNKNIPERKVREAEELAEMLKAYAVVSIANLYKVRAAQLQELKKKLRGNVEIRVTKNTIMQRAFERCEKIRPNINKLSEFLTGSNIFLFTNMNPFKLSLFLERNKVKTTAKAGDIAQTDIVVPSGNTGLAPGPVISELNEVGLLTKIETGSVWIARDTVVAKKGETISPKLASVLSRLGIKPIEVGLSIKAAYDEGTILTENDLRIDLQKIIQQIQEAHTCAFNVAVNAAYPCPETAIPLLHIAQSEAFNLALNAVVFDSPTISKLIISKAYSEALSLETYLTTVTKQSAAAEKTSNSEEKVQKEEPKQKKETTAEKK